MPSELIAKRSSTPSRLMCGPGPDAQQLGALLQLAMRVPDHGKLAPWRFVVIQGAQRQRLATLLVATRRAKESEVTSEALEKDAQRFLYAPCIVAVVACITPAHKIPESEQHASAAAVCMQLLNAAFAHGFAAQWLTGWAAYDAVILAALGLAANEHVSGFVHLGHSEAAPVERARPALNDKLRFY